MNARTEWAYLPLNEERVVAQQIRNRSRLDAAYYAKQCAASPLAAQGSFGIMEDVLCTYIDLDRLIEDCEFNEGQIKLIRAVMNGYSTRDMDETWGWPAGRAEKTLQAMTRRIMRENDRRWKRCYGGKLSRR